MWVANVISQYISYNPTSSERYYTHFTLASIYSALYGFQTINGSQQLVSYYSGGIAGMLSSTNNYLYTILGRQLDIYDRMDAFRYVVDSGMLSLDVRLRDSIGSRLVYDNSAGNLIDAPAGVLSLGQLFATFYNRNISALRTISNIDLTYLGTLPGSSKPSWSAAELLARAVSLVYNIEARTLYDNSSGMLLDASEPSYNIVQLLALSYNRITAGLRLFSSVLPNLDARTLYDNSAGNLVDAPAPSYNVAQLLALTYNRVASGSSRLISLLSAIEARTLYDNSSGSLLGVSGSSYNISQLLAMSYNRLHRISDVVGDSLSVSVDFPALDAVYAKLDGIMDLMRLGLAVDVADAILGDLDFSGLSALTADVAGALDSAFPFCIPALLKQVLGLVQADPSPPSFHFDVMGAPLDFDFSGYQGFADVTGWVCRLTLVFVLLAASPRFVVGSKVGGA